MVSSSTEGTRGPRILRGTAAIKAQMKECIRPRPRFSVCTVWCLRLQRHGVYGGKGMVLTTAKAWCLRLQRHGVYGGKGMVFTNAKAWCLRLQRHGVYDCKGMVFTTAKAWCLRLQRLGVDDHGCISQNMTFITLRNTYRECCPCPCPCPCPWHPHCHPCHQSRSCPCPCHPFHQRLCHP